MRMRFCATILKPAFSISALTAPVRLRAVASGLMIEKVRSVAMSFSPQINGDFALRRLYRRPACPASDLGRHREEALTTGITTISRWVKEVCNAHAGPVHQHPHRLQSTGSPVLFE